MANYIPWYGKKRARLVEHERRLMRALQANAEPDEIAEAAEQVRAGQIRTLKAKRAQLPPAEAYSPSVEQLNLEIQRWRSMPTEAIVEAYRDGKQPAQRGQSARYRLPRSR